MSKPNQRGKRVINDLKNIPKDKTDSLKAHSAPNAKINPFKQNSNSQNAQLRDALAEAVTQNEELRQRVAELQALLV